MEESKWKKDETPYIIFTCFKCKQYAYVKQEGVNTKRCPRCKYRHQVKNIKPTIIVKGMTAALNEVKMKQNEFAIEKLGMKPDLKSENDFCIAINIDHPIKIIKNNQKDETGEIDYEENFYKLLIELSRSYKEFPVFMIELLIKDFNIPKKELKFLIKSSIRKKVIIPVLSKNNYFKFNFN
jgi:hypothetical protein